jgi:hypothetical protein
MKRALLIGVAGVAGALALPAMALAASGDVQRLDVDNPVVVFDDGDKAAIEGDVECRVEDTWGIIMKLFGDGDETGSEDFQPLGNDDTDFVEEGLGFGGPGSGNQGPVEQPCGEQGSPFDLVLEKLGTSNDFQVGTDVGLWALVAESPTQQADPAFLGDAEVFFGVRDLVQED